MSTDYVDPAEIFSAAGRIPLPYRRFGFNRLHIRQVSRQVYAY